MRIGRIWLKQSHSSDQEIKPGSSLKMTDLPLDDFAREIHLKRKKIRFFWLLLLIFLGVIVTILLMGAPYLILLSVVLVGLFTIVLAYFRDKIAKNAVILYDLDKSAASVYKSFLDAFDELQHCAKIWHIEAIDRVHNSKYRAGASRSMRRSAMKISVGTVNFIKANIDIPKMSMSSGERTLVFLPDRLLVVDPKTVRLISYSELRVSLFKSKVIGRAGKVPPDATVIGRTWQYVNKDGGPDRRFKNNPRRPVVLYQRVLLRGPHGFRETIQFSRSEGGSSFKRAITELGKFIDYTITESAA
jgi:hypothetical protein